MISLRIESKKEFMSMLLKGNIFDDYFLEEATIDTFNTFTINGLIHRDFYSQDEITDDLNEYSRWSDVKPICFDLIKGKNTPLSFKFILHSSDELKERLIKEADFGIDKSQINLCLNIKFQKGEIILTTAVSYSIFTLDKSIEKAWDNYIPSYLDSDEINCSYSQLLF